MGANQSSIQQGIDPSSPGARSRPRRTRKLSQRAAQVILAFLLCAGCFLSLTPWGRAITRATFLLPALLSASEPAPLVLAGDPVRFSRITLSSATGPIFLDIYEPATPPPPIPGGREAIIDVAGAGDNRAIPQLVNLSRAFAREGIILVTVGTPSLFRYQVSAQDGEAVVQAFQLIEHWPGVNPNAIGLLGFSVGALAVCIAAADPRIRDRVAFLGIFGGYFDVTSFLRTVGSRAQNVDGQTEPWPSTPTTLNVLASTVNSLLSPPEQQLLQKAFPENKSGPPLTAREQAQLSPGTLAFYHLLEGDQRGSVERNLAALSPSMKALFARLSPLSVIDQVRAPVHLLHDRNDPSVPFTQAQEFAETLARLHHPYDFAAYNIFLHTQVRSNLALAQLLSDGTKLFQLLYRSVLVGS